MDIKEAYNVWSAQYDSNKNKTRDLEALSLKETVSGLSFTRCLEIGCGTGKNTGFLLKKANTVTAVDFSEGMLAEARKKISSPNVVFIQKDISGEWDFDTETHDLVVFSLVMEHFELVNSLFKKAKEACKEGGFIYISELHPYKQYTGTKARFDSKDGRQELTCYPHHVSEYLEAAKENSLSLLELKEYFDEGNKTQLPRLITFLFQKVKS